MTYIFPTFDLVFHIHTYLIKKFKKYERNWNSLMDFWATSRSKDSQCGQCMKIVHQSASDNLPYLNSSALKKQSRCILIKILFIFKKFSHQVDIKASAQYSIWNQNVTMSKFHMVNSYLGCSQFLRGPQKRFNVKSNP